MMTKPKLHRWELCPEKDLYRCVDADLGGVDSGLRRWPGCGVEVTMKELFDSGLCVQGDEVGLGVALTMISRSHDG
jgi:hypothetical protein